MKLNKSKRILIIDYGMGNIQSIINAFKQINIAIAISKSKKDILKYNNYILPGVGAYGEAMKKLIDYKIKDVLIDQVKNKKKPILGICLGMQLLSSSSNENGFYYGLNLIKGKVKSLTKLNKRYSFETNVGWSNILFNEKNNFFNNINKRKNFYFDHSYFFDAPKKCTISHLNYKSNLVPVIVKQNNILGIQFHPEKSQITGLRLLKNISENFLKY